MDELMLARVDDGGDRLAVVNLNIRQRGALSPELYGAIHDACELAQDDRITSIIIRAEGGFFCAGGNLNMLRERGSLPEAERRARVDELHDVIRAIHAAPVPVIAVIDGGAAGAGLSLALACDLIVAEESAQFTASYVNAGLVPDGGLTVALAQSLPRTLAMELCVLGQPLSARRLHEAGVVNVLAPDGAALSAAEEIADRLSKGPRAARTTIKSLVQSAYDNDTGEQMDRERDAMASAVVASEGKEGIAAFLEKRKPRFR